MVGGLKPCSAATGGYCKARHPGKLKYVPLGAVSNYLAKAAPEKSPEFYLMQC
jgi:hypothetical protein